MLWHTVTCCGLLCYVESEVRREMAAEAGGDLEIPEVERFDSNIITPVSQQSRTTSAGCSMLCLLFRLLCLCTAAHGLHFMSQGGLMRPNSGIEM